MSNLKAVVIPRRASLAALVLLPLGLAGCANGSMPYVFQAQGFSDEEVQTLQSAADEWCSKSNGEHCAMVTTDPPGFEASTVTLTDAVETKHSVGGVVVRKQQSEALGTCQAMVNHAGVRSTSDCATNPDAEYFMIQVVNGRQGDRGVNWFHGKKTTWNVRLRTIFLHEIGHAFGHPHCPKEGTVMNASTTYEVEHLTEDDLAN